MINLVSIPLCLLFSGVLSKYQLKEGSDCVLGNGKKGICVKESGCVRLRTRDGRLPWEQCGFTGIKVLYCCIGSVKIAEKACESYRNTVTPKTQHQISGGTLAKRGAFPHMVALWYDTPPDSDGESTPWRCGGSLISAYYVLTAAHCLDDGKPTKIRVGDTDIKATSDDDTASDYNIAEVIVHPRYNRKVSLYNDIALLKTEEKIQFSRYIFPACIQTTLRIEASEFGITGWGQADFNEGGLNETNQPLRTAQVQAITSQSCSRAYTDFNAPNANGFIPNGIASGQICAKTYRKKRSNTCMGDSGGPLHYRSGDVFYIAGITSIGPTCGGSLPGIYTRVSSYASWISIFAWKHP